MRDYVNYFAGKRRLDKHGVDVKKDVDWWAGYILSRMGKMLFLVLMVIICFAVKFIYDKGKNQAHFPIGLITLTGDVVLTEPKHIQQSVIALGYQSFYGLNLQKVTNQIEALPWVEKARVTRKWPDELVIDVEERVAKYRWGENELLDSYGNRFTNIKSDAFLQLPRLGGADGHELEVIEAYEQLRIKLGDNMQHLGFSSFSLNQYLSWELHLKSGLVIKFGRDDFKERLNLFSDAYSQGRLPSFVKIESIDLRYQTGFSVKWKPEFAPAALSTPMLQVNAKQI
ncbi:MAG: cell division protein FtsQ/DivIB [Gammaproteobacteria bacterium]|nr:cell division protein FtsQ/DivIB [Gammaproteobacteria bacterium]